MPVDQNTLVSLMELLDQVYQPQSPPGLSMTQRDCTGTATSAMAS